LSSLTIALDGIAVIVNNANPLTNISIENIKKIYTGEILYWKDLK
ncbi:MAG: substrate-binding domain-containing protein, partial [Spirochaetales bacterium]|nr:substrate-binding domain-containing protein [Spirochaetales bacterium]